MFNALNYNGFKIFTGIDLFIYLLLNRDQIIYFNLFVVFCLLKVVWVMRNIKYMYFYKQHFFISAGLKLAKNQTYVKGALMQI